MTTARLAQLLRKLRAIGAWSRRRVISDACSSRTPGGAKLDIAQRWNETSLHKSLDVAIAYPALELTLLDDKNKRRDRVSLAALTHARHDDWRRPRRAQLRRPLSSARLRRRRSRRITREDFDPDRAPASGFYA